MKKIIFPLLFVFIGILSVNAQTQSSPETESLQERVQQKQTMRLYALISKDFHSKHDSIREIVTQLKEDALNLTDESMKLSNDALLLAEKALKDNDNSLLPEVDALSKKSDELQAEAKLKFEQMLQLHGKADAYMEVGNIFVQRANAIAVKIGIVARE